MRGGGEKWRGQGSRKTNEQRGKAVRAWRVPWQLALTATTAWIFLCRPFQAAPGSLVIVGHVVLENLPQVMGWLVLQQIRGTATLA